MPSHEATHGRSVAGSYGDPAGEYRAAREEAALVELSERAVLAVGGPRRLPFLQGMVSNDVAHRQPGQGCRAALMTSKGSLLALLRVLVEQERVALETDTARLDLVQGTLERHRVAAPVRFARPPTTVLALLGPRADAVASAVAGAPPPAEPEAHVTLEIAGVAARLVRAGDLPGGGVVVHLPPHAAASTWEALRSAGARPIGREALDALRVEALRPWYGADVTEANLLHETGLVAECHAPGKGCYLGQEVIARLEARGGNVNKALRGLKLTRAARSGEAILAEGREVGRITTAAVSPRLGPIAMGYVHRSHFAPGASVRVGDAPASVVTRFDG